MPLATRPHINNNHKQNHKSSPSIRRYDKSHDGISTKFKATTPPSAPISTDEIGFKSGPSTNYFERKNRPIIKDKGPCARVELMISARTLADRDFFSKSDPVCIVEEMTTRYARDDSKNEFVEIGRTECIKNSLNPVWNKRITLDYYFESKQLLRFKIYDIDSESAKLSEHDFLGKCECELADIVAAPNGICVMKVFSCKDVPRQGGLLLVCAEELDEGQRDIAHFSLRGVALNSGGSFLRKCILNPNTFLEFYRLLCDGSRQMIYRTELARNTKNPEWKPFELRVNQLCKGDKGSDFLIECYDQREATGNHHLIGSTQTSLNALTSHQQNQLELIKTKKNKGVPLKVPKGILHFMDVQIRKEFTFLDFIASGLQLEFAVAVDLTASNGEISKSSSLHYVNSQYLNQYECAICAVLEICEHYNHSKMFETIGFGAKIPPAFTVSHMFPLRLNNFERSVEGIQGVLDAYRYAIVNTQLYGPTNFAPTIREFVHKCQQFPRDGTKYQVLLILTDGIITDMQNTIEALIEASHEPLSIIIIGIGKEDFKKMEFLDSDNRLLTYNGNVASRDIVQFVPFREFIGSAWGITPEEQAILKTLLGREVLAELPAQVCSFMKANSIVPLRSRAPSECAMKKPQIFAHKQLQLNSRLGSLNSTVNPDQQQSGTSLQNLPPDIERFPESVIAKPPYPEF